MTLEYIFPTPIYYSHVNDFDTIQSELKAVIDTMEFHRNPEWDAQWGKTHYLSDVNFSGNFVETYDVPNFRQEIETHVKQYCAEMEHRRELNFRIISSWVAMFKESNHGHVHHHGYADLAGVYYFKTNKDDGNIFFECPNPYLPVSYCYQQFAATWEHQPQEGKILLFPAWLKHGIKPNKTNDTRMSISFNISFDKNA